jgi:peptide chain release factor 2
LKEKSQNFKRNSKRSGGFFDLPAKIESIKIIGEKMNAQNFWDDAAAANKEMSQLRYCKSCVDPYEKSVKKLTDLKELSELSVDDEQMLDQIQQELAGLEKEIRAVEITAFMSGQFDRSNVIFSINAGAGGTESCDWASMLLRMYMRWFEGKGFKVQTIDILPGEEAGIKNVTLRIDGEMAYGLMKGEKGVHRLGADFAV